MTSQRPTILVIDDEAPIRRFLHSTLTNNGYTPIEAVSAAEGLRLARQQQPAVIILDLGLPDLDGVAVTQQIRSWSGVPIIILSARDQERDKVQALDAGADDYLTKPFGVPELLARIRVALRRQISDSRPPSALQFGDLTVDLERRQIRLAGQEVHLTPIEYRLLTALALHAGRVMTHRQLLTSVWGGGYAEDTALLRVHIGQLRRKIEANPARPRYLLTELGVGYRLREADDPDG
jgi:two-component system KDP operon response regulator KdpE